MRMAPVVLALLIGSSLSAQPVAPDTAARRKAMEKLSFLVGDWAGDASASAGPGKQVRMWHTEWVRYKLRGQVIALEGVGRLRTEGAPGDTVFSAWGTITWSPERGYVMRSNVLDGHDGEFALQPTDSGFTWGMEVPAGRVRYTMRITPEGEWHERGEFSRDGLRWYPTVDMKLRRTSTAMAR